MEICGVVKIEAPCFPDC